MSRRATSRTKYWLALAVGLFVAGLVVAVRMLLAPPEGPVPVSWDREACAHCHMHIGDPAFAAQLQVKAGDVLNFDDPGCLIRYLEAYKPEVHALYFHHLEEERWLSAEEVAFRPISPTPMGYGLGAVLKGTPGSISLAEAKARIIGGVGMASDGHLSGGK